ncbi:PDZ domain-containing protein [Schlesneria paludicola]|uniref:PDZ domain-containing protein n=1 Tax=Schlesneria paludicola TaxID=360056 RepID=UPI0012FAB615|nr:PDZ domain-containing protein [Schlesneria paludicola]
MQSRLSALEQQIDRRQLQRQPIIERRMGVLLEDDGTDWNFEVSKDSGLDRGQAQRGVQSSDDVVIEKRDSTNRAALESLDPDQESEALTQRNYLGKGLRKSDFSEPTRELAEAATPDELASKVLRAREELIEAESQVALSAAGKLPNATLDVTRARRDHARRRVAIVEGAFNSRVRESLLQFDSATENVKGTEDRVILNKQMFSNARIPYKDVLDAEALVQSQKLSLLGAKTQRDLYKEISEQLFPRDTPSTMNRLPTSDSPTWGMTLKPISATQDEMKAIVKNSKYRGGMLIVDVQEKSPAAQNGIRAGDILVGLEKWETISDASVQWIVSNLKRQTILPDASTEVKVFLIRGHETVVTNLPMLPLIRASR